MTIDEARAIFDAHQRRSGQAAPAEFTAYLQAKRVLAAAGLLVLTPGQRGFLAAARLPSTTTTEEIGP